MIAENNKYMEALAGSVCTLCNDPKFVEECERHLRGEWEYNSMTAEANRKGMAQGILNKLIRHFSLNRDEAEKYYKQYACEV